MRDNRFLTSDIRISTDSTGCMTAEHKHQGVLVDGGYYGSRTECRQDAVLILKDMRSGTEYG